MRKRTHNNIAARAGRWSAQHRKKAIVGWLVFVILAFGIGGIDTAKQWWHKLAPRPSDGSDGSDHAEAYAESYGQGDTYGHTESYGQSDSYGQAGAYGDPDSYTEDTGYGQGQGDQPGGTSPTT
jgi:hypothetical protein